MAPELDTKGTRTFREIVLANVARYPLAQAVDLYKLSYQAALGTEHAVTDIKASRTRLDQELLEKADAPYDSLSEPIFETISPGGDLERINLRPFLRMGGDPDRLFKAFIRTASKHRGDVTTFHGCWNIIVQLAECGQIPFQAVQLSEFINEKSSAGLPPVHHSRVYRQAYRPSYRVVASEFLQDLSLS